MVAMLSFSNEQVTMLQEIGASVPYSRRTDYLQQLAKLVGRRGDDLGDGELHRLALAARAAVLPVQQLQPGNAAIDGRR
jgi:hypothetical protein